MTVFWPALVVGIAVTGFAAYLWLRRRSLSRLGIDVRDGEPGGRVRPALVARVLAFAAISGAALGLFMIVLSCFPGAWVRG
ncbi:MAG: hypothetical protein HGA44_13615 [Cellulomonadaceae bacterium]|nr:hypothetical protein [Cellulomonadaceae bacterium]